MRLIIPIKIIQNVPIAVMDTFYLNEDEPFVSPISILENDLDEDTNPSDLSAALVNSVGQGALILNEEGTFTYTPELDFNGQDGFTYRVFDLDGNADTTVVLFAGKTQ